MSKLVIFTRQKVSWQTIFTDKSVQVDHILTREDNKFTNNSVGRTIFTGEQCARKYFLVNSVRADDIYLSIVCTQRIFTSKHFPAKRTIFTSKQCAYRPYLLAKSECADHIFV